MPWSMAHGGVGDKHRRVGLESPRPPGPRVGIAPSSKYGVPFFLSLVLVPKFHGAPKTNRRLQGHASLSVSDHDHRAANFQRKIDPIPNLIFADTA